MAFRVATAAFFFFSVFWGSQSKIYDRCELARELRDVHEMPEEQLPTWLCITNYESHYNTSAHNPGSGDHGLFQISELFWCSPPGNGDACGLPCSALKDEDIEDDVICARRIYRQHQRISGDGFTAWVVYNLHCRNEAHVASFIQGCFDDENVVKIGYQPVHEEINLVTQPLAPLVSSLSPTTPPRQPPSTQELFSSTYKPPVVPFRKPEVSVTPNSIITSFKSTSVPKVSTYSPSKESTYNLLSSRFSSTTNQFLGSTYKPSPPPRATTYKPFSSTFLSSTTNKLLGSSYKPSPSPTTFKPFSGTFLSTTTNKFLGSSTPSANLLLTTSKPGLTISGKSGISTTVKPSYSTSSGITPSVNSHNNGFSKVALVKTREVQASAPINLQSGVKSYRSFQPYKNDEKVYAFVNKSGYTFAISSKGFKLFRTGNK